MLVGFNHNIMYRGEVFHVQTEDSGVDNPNIVTLLYKGGVIFGSIKTSYSDIVKMDNLAQVVEELMKEQHKQMMRRLKGGEFDARLFPGEGSGGEPTEPEASAMEAAQEPPAEPVSEQASPVAEKAEPGEKSLDEAILAFFGVDS